MAVARDSASTVSLDTTNSCSRACFPTGLRRRRALSPSTSSCPESYDRHMDNNRSPSLVLLPGNQHSMDLSDSDTFSTAGGVLPWHRCTHLQLASPAAQDSWWLAAALAKKWKAVTTEPANKDNLHCSHCSQVPLDQLVTSAYVQLQISGHCAYTTLEDFHAAHPKIGHSHMLPEFLSVTICAYLLCQPLQGSSWKLPLGSVTSHERQPKHSLNLLIS